MGFDETRLDELVARGKALLDEEKYEEGFACHMEAAELGDYRSMNSVGWCYRGGYGVEQDTQKAIEWFEKSIAGGSEKAPLNLALIYDDSDSSSYNPELAFENYRLSVQRGYSYAMERLASCYLDGNGCETNFKLAAYWSMKAIESGDDSAYFSLGCILRDGFFFAQCPAYARYCFEKFAEYNECDWEYCLDDDDDEINEQMRALRPVKPNLPPIDDSYPEFFTEEDPLRMYCSGLSLLTGKAAGGEAVEVNPVQGKAMLEKAADRGLAMAQVALAWRYLDTGDGHGILYDENGGVSSLGADADKALFYFSLAARQGDEFAIRSLADLYTHGDIGIEPNRDKAREYWQLLEKLYQNVREAVAFGGVILDDFDEFFSIFPSDAKARAAMKYIDKGKAALEGGDKDEAKRHFRKATVFQSGEAAYLLGEIYDGEQDYQNAVKWFTAAADRHYPNSREKLKMAQAGLDLMQLFGGNGSLS